MRNAHKSNIGYYQKKIISLKTWIEHVSVCERYITQQVQVQHTKTHHTYVRNILRETTHTRFIKEAFLDVKFCSLELKRSRWDSLVIHRLHRIIRWVPAAHFACKPTLIIIISSSECWILCEFDVNYHNMKVVNRSRFVLYAASEQSRERNIIRWKKKCAWETANAKVHWHSKIDDILHVFVFYMQSTE